MESTGSTVYETALDGFVKYEEIRKGLIEQENAWLVFTVIGASILITLIAIFGLYDLCNRFKELVNQQIFDGGPPSSPGHLAAYTIQMQVDEANSAFDAKRSILRVEFLDSLNQFITNIVIPCFLFKFKGKIADIEVTNSPPMVRPRDQANPSIAFTTQPGLNPTTYKSLSAYYETWQNLVRSNILSFSLIRRLPMQNLNSIRVTHDCFVPGAQITLKHIIVRDNMSRTGSRVDLQNKPLKALHICPPSSFQVFTAEPLDSISRELNESKSWVQLLTVPEIVALLLVYYQLSLIFSPLTYMWFKGKDNIKSCLMLGLAVAACTLILSTILLTIYLYLRRTVTNPFKITQLSTILLILTLFTCALLCFYSVYNIIELKKEHASFALHLILILLVAGTTLTLLLILTTGILALLKVNSEPPQFKSNQNELTVLAT